VEQTVSNDRLDIANGDVQTMGLRASTLSERFVELDIPARADFLALARQVVVAVARTESSFGEDRLENLRLAVSEACTNAIRAHSMIGSQASIHIRCELGEGRIVVEVADHGTGFDPDDVPVVPPATDPNRLLFESGLGIPLMQLFTDRTEITSSPSGTNVRLVLLAMPLST
jgi:serine/threonine-protein kinase RsbW